MASSTSPPPGLDNTCGVILPPWIHMTGVISIKETPKIISSDASQFGREEIIQADLFGAVPSGDHEGVPDRAIDLDDEHGPRAREA